MEIDDNLEIVCLCPTDGIIEVGCLPLDVRLARPNIKGPIADRDTHVIESKIRTTRSLTVEFERNALLHTQLLQWLQSHSR